MLKDCNGLRMARLMHCSLRMNGHTNQEDHMHKITLTNDFHNTAVTVLSEYDSPSETWYHIQENIHCFRGADAPTMAQKAKYRRIKNALCGADDCQCGTVR